jgi:hypothetical protein
MSADHGKDWRTLCEAVAKETDPDRFMALVIELNNALDERERRRDGILHNKTNPRGSLLSG